MLFAQEQRVGYVHMGKLFDAYYRSVEANVTLEEKKLDLQKGMKLLRNDLESLAREVQKAPVPLGTVLNKLGIGT